MERQPILLVEDEPADVKLVKRALKRAELSNTLQVVTSIAEAKSRCSTPPGPVLLFLDVCLNPQTSLDFLEWLRGQEPPAGDIPAIVFCVSPEEAHRARAMAVRASQFLTKPATEEMLADAIIAFGLVRTTEVTGGRTRRWLEKREP
jgi:CheY-like chemotaxis protein